MVKLTIFQAVLLLVLLLLFQTCKSGHEYKSSPSSCGHIHNISYPFRLKTDPINCGNKSYEISCENNVPILWYYPSEKYYVVRSINYNNYTIRLSDESLIPFTNRTSFFCDGSLTSQYPRAAFDFEYDNYFSSFWEGNRSFEYKSLWQSLVIVSCPGPMPNSTKDYLYADIEDSSICSTSESNWSSNSSSYSSNWYVMITDRFPLDVDDLVESCRVELIQLTSMPPNITSGNVSFKDVYDSLEYGFELSWLVTACFSKFCPLIFKHGNPCRLPPAALNYPSCSYEPSASPSPSPFRLWSRSLLRRLESSPLGHLLSMINRAPALKKNMTTFEYVSSFLHYVVLLFVLHHAPFLVVLAPLLLVLLLHKWRTRHLSTFANIEEFLQSYDQLMPIRYSYRNIKKITKGFKDKLGEGGCGSVYKGQLRSGYFAAVKVLGNSKSDDGKEFINEVATIGRIHHFNVVRLIGFCAERSKRALVYEFMPNGSLDKYIFSREGDKNTIPIVSNEKMYEIAIGIARGIEYLHQGCEMQILHFDLKPHNILLDKNFIPKISDFGLAKLCPTDKNHVSLTAIRGTMGYMAPELFYRSIGDISYKADVYSYGRMLMEMAARKRDLKSSAEHSSQIFFPSWVHDQFTEGRDIDLGDDTTEEDKEIMKKMLIVSLWCVQLDPIDRPSMHKVVEMLEGGIQRLQLPPKPSFAPQLPMLMEDSSMAITTQVSLLVQD